MVAGAERHFWIDHDVVVGPRYVGVKRTVHHDAVADNDRLEIILLPFAVPVAALDQGRRVRDRAVERKIGEHISYRGFVKSLLPYISRQPLVVGDKTLVIVFGKHPGEQIARVFRAWCEIKSHFIVIVH